MRGVLVRVLLNQNSAKFEHPHQSRVRDCDVAKLKGRHAIGFAACRFTFS
jgi:hypothetical protein